MTIALSRAEQEVDKEDLQEEEEPAGDVDHVRRSFDALADRAGRAPSGVREDARLRGPWTADRAVDVKASDSPAPAPADPISGAA